jgi:hypothetical protein
MCNKVTGWWPCHSKPPKLTLHTFIWLAKHRVKILIKNLTVGTPISTTGSGSYWARPSERKELPSMLISDIPSAFCWSETTATCADHFFRAGCFRHTSCQHPLELHCVQPDVFNQIEDLSAVVLVTNSKSKLHASYCQDALCQDFQDVTARRLQSYKTFVTCSSSGHSSPLPPA